MKLVVATNNPHKLKEYQRLTTAFKLVTLAKPPLIQETGTTLRANAIIKAKAFARFTNLLVMADDTGLFIDFLNGRPGIRSARWANGDFAAARKQILTLLSEVPLTKRTARFECVIALYHRPSRKLKTFTGTSRGLINQSEAGNQGFGYDPIFYHRKLKKTFGQATAKEKDQVSHRAKAFQKLTDYLIITATDDSSPSQ